MQLNHQFDHQYVVQALIPICSKEKAGDQLVKLDELRYQAILSDTKRHQVIPRNTKQYHAILSKTMWYYAFYHHLQGRIGFNTVNLSLSTGKNYLVHSLMMNRTAVFHQNQVIGKSTLVLMEHGYNTEQYVLCNTMQYQTMPSSTRQLNLRRRNSFS